MSNPAFVILTDPGRCELAEAETLVQALLQVQKLHEAGVPTSQAFCDHPAAAMEFIDAYSQAYHALQVQTSDLPLPQHLYSMVADGRLSLLPPAEAAETTKLEQTGNPLYVLSLGAPDALMQVLEHNSLARSNIRVLEIEPIERVKADPVSVAEAVAAAPLARSSWLTDHSSTPERHDADASGIELLADDTDDTVELSSIEVDLDRIQIDRAGDRQSYDQSGHAYGEPAPSFITAAAAPGPSTSEVDRHTTAEPAASYFGGPNPSSPPTAPATPASESVSDTLPASPPDLAGTSITQSDVTTVVVESPSEGGIAIPVEPAPNDIEPSDLPFGDPCEQDSGTGVDGSTSPATGPAQSKPDVDEEAAASPSTTEGDEEDSLAGNSSVFAIPGEDVLYHPSASFAGNDDLAYALPTEDAGEPSSFAPFFDSMENSEVIDLEAMFGGLSEPAAEDCEALRDFDFMLMPVPRSNGAGRNDDPSAYSSGEESAPPINPEPAEDDSATNSLTAVYDADV